MSATRILTRAATVAACSAVLACGAGDGPVPAVERVAVESDSIIVIGAEPALALATAFDAAGAELEGRSVSWRTEAAFPWGVPPTPPDASDILAVEADGDGTAHLRPLSPGRVWLVATVGPASDSLLVHVEQPRSGPLWLNVTSSDTLEVAPGAWFKVGARDVVPTLEGRFYSSDSTVAAWSPVTYPRPIAPWDWYPYLRRLDVRAVGVATVSIAYGGQTASLVLRVRDPGTLQMDERGRCGLNAAGELWCKGPNQYGQLGAFTPIETCNRWCYLQDVSVPVHGARGLRFRALTSGDEYSCGIALDDSRAYCWGLDRVSSWESVGRLAGNIRSTLDVEYCPVQPASPSYVPIYCSAAPLPVDGQLSQRLVFRTIKAVGRVTCGTTGGPGEPEELWCWGDTNLPTKRDAFPAGF